MLNINFHPFPQMQTERLLLRKLMAEDTDNMFLLRTNKDAMKYIGRPIPKEKKEVEDLIQKINDNIQSNTGIVWGISLKNEPALIGTIGFHRIEIENYRAEVGYMLMPDYWYKGIMNEVLSEVLAYGFMQLNFHSIEAKIDPGNSNSRKILLKNGFIKEAYFKENHYVNGKFLDSEIYSLLKSNFIK